jgi:GMP synthase (glutamine-hydrolysing)
MARRIVLIKHDEAPCDDRASDHLSRLGYALDWRRPFKGDWPEPLDEEVAGTILYGGPFNIADTLKLPFMGEEMRWIEACMARELPVLGICQGGQMVAHVLGAHVGPADHGLHEFGYYEIAATEAGRELFPERLVVSQSHYHEFQIPQGARHLARSEAYENQAFSHGDKVFGFQFHAEVTRDGFRRWQQRDNAPYDKPGVQTREEQDRRGDAHDAAQDAWFRGFLDHLFGPSSE